MKKGLDYSFLMCYYQLTIQQGLKGASPIHEKEKMKMKKMSKILCLVLALAMIFAFAACGKTEKSSDNVLPASDSDVAPAAPASDSDVAALPTIEDGKLIMSLNASFPPYESTDDNGDIVGIDVDIAKAIADKLGLELVIDDMDFDAALLAVQQGKCDIAMSGISITEQRLTVMDFSDPYTTAVQSIIVKEGSDVTLDNLGEQLIGTVRGYTGNMYCVDDYGEDHVVAYDDGAAVVLALVNGQVDCVVIDDEPARAYAEANPGLAVLDTEYAVEEYAIGLTKGNDAVNNAVNNALNELIADGTIKSIIDSYLNK